MRAWLCLCMPFLIALASPGFAQSATEGGSEAEEPAAAMLADAERVFTSVFSERCQAARAEGRTEGEPETHEIAYRYMHETADDPMRTARLFRFACNQGAYNMSHVHLMTDGEGPVEPVYFAIPELDIRYEDDQMEGRVEQMTQLGFITRAELANSQYDADTQTLTSLEKWRGAGDASAAGRWIFRYGAFSLVGYEVDATYDGQINPVDVLGMGETP